MVTAFFSKALTVTSPFVFEHCSPSGHKKNNFQYEHYCISSLSSELASIKKTATKKYFKSGPHSTSTIHCVAAPVYIQKLPDSIASQNFLDLILQREPIFLFYSSIYRSIVSKKPMIASCVILFWVTAILLSSLSLLRVVFVLVSQYIHWWVIFALHLISWVFCVLPCLCSYYSLERL